MGILGGYPSNVSHLVNQTQPHIQAERHKSQQRKKYKELATLPGITAVKKFPKKTINTLLFLTHYRWCASPEMHDTLVGTNLPEYISRNLILHLNQIPRKEPKY
jgi:hypothetical protein